MQAIGFEGGGLMIEIGSAEDMVCFFSYLEKYVVQFVPEQDWSLISDRLYKRYLRLDELDLASDLMRRAHEIFSTKFVLGMPSKQKSQLLISETMPVGNDFQTLAELFSGFFNSFKRSVECAKLNYECFKSSSASAYIPVRITLTNIPIHFQYSSISLTVFDELEGEPLWLRLSLYK